MNTFIVKRKVDGPDISDDQLPMTNDKLTRR